MSTVDVLAKHQLVSWGLGHGPPDKCLCEAEILPEPGPDEVGARRRRAFAQHQMDALLQSRPTWFSYERISSDLEGYYHDRWDLAVPVEVVAADQEEALKKVWEVSGPPPKGKFWKARLKKVKGS